MIGITNAIEQRTKWNVDSDTLLLITDTIEDKSGHNLSITNAGCTISNGIQRDGRNSISAINSSTGLAVSNSAAQFTTYLMQSNNWTIEFWAYVTSWYNGEAALVEMNLKSGIGYGFLWIFGSSQTTYLSSNATSWNRWNNYAIGMSNIVNEWVHYAISVQWPNVYMFQNGIITFNVNFSGGPLGTIESGNTWFGCRGQTSSGNGHKVNFQDIRVSKCARYIANFTPPERFI